MSRKKRPISFHDRSDEISKRIGIEMPHGLVLMRLYENGQISIGHTDASSIILKPDHASQQGGVVIEWNIHKPILG